MGKEAVMVNQAGRGGWQEGGAASLLITIGPAVAQNPLWGMKVLGMEARRAEAPEGFSAYACSFPEPQTDLGLCTQR